MKKLRLSLGSILLVGLLSLAVAAQGSSAGRYDNAIQTRAAQELAKRQDCRNTQAAVEDGIVTLTGTVDLYQQKLDAAKKVRKISNVQGVRNLIEVAGASVPDAQLAAHLERKVYYDRIGFYDNAFNFVHVSVKDGVVTLTGETYNDVGRDSALALVNSTPGVKDVVDNIKVAPVSNFDDRIRISAMRAYRDPVLGRYATDPAKPIRIVVENGKLALYGTVESSMDKQVAGIRASQVFGTFSVQNNLEVEKRS